jgi:hypothetical protein
MTSQEIIALAERLSKLSPEKLLEIEELRREIAERAEQMTVEQLHQLIGTIDETDRLPDELG